MQTFKCAQCWDRQYIYYSQVWFQPQADGHEAYFYVECTECSARHKVDPSYIPPYYKDRAREYALRKPGFFKRLLAAMFNDSRDGCTA